LIFLRNRIDLPTREFVCDRWVYCSVKQKRQWR